MSVPARTGQQRGVIENAVRPISALTLPHTPSRHDPPPDLLESYADRTPGYIWRSSSLVECRSHVFRLDGE